MIPIKEITSFKTNSFIRLAKEVKKPKNVLVVGSGNGTEVASLGMLFPEGNVYGIDPGASNITFNNCVIESGDAQNMRFGDKAFDLVYSYHVLEHIPDPVKALQEIKRVVADDGYVLIGTPNRQRLLGYFSGDATFIQKIRWNLKDWWDKIRGRFRNELGAHAGFTHKEMKQLLGEYFNQVKDVTREYYEEIYKTKKRYLRLIYAAGVQDLLFPAIYYIAKN